MPLIDRNQKILALADTCGLLYNKMRSSLTRAWLYGSAGWYAHWHWGWPRQRDSKFRPFQPSVR